jgi:hypothetical protein
MLLHHYFGFLSQSLTVRVVQTLLLSQQSEAVGPNLLAGLGRFHPVEFAKATNGFVYIADGLHSVVKWDGVKRDIIVVGVAAPTTAAILAVSGSGDITGTYEAYVRFYDEEGNVSNLSPVSNQVTADDNSTFTYTSVPVSADPKVVGRQILRNTAGQFLVFYVDVDTNDLTETTFTSTNEDADLRQQTAVPLFDENFTIELANRNGVPPNDKPLITYYENRLWMYGEVPYSEGMAQVTFGSTSVTGIGTRWTTEMADRYLYVSGERKSYEISSVNETTQVITLETEYLGVTDLFAEYAIRSAPTRRHVLAYSESGRFDAWPAIQELEVASSDDIDDDPSGLCATQSFLYILQRRHIYRMTFREDPARDGGIFLAARRGVVNNRSWVTVDNHLYALDDRGIYRFDGADQAEDIAQAIQDLFYMDREPGELRINWRASRFFHAAHDRHDATIRWFVSLSGDYLPRHALCFNYSTPQWWIEEYPFPCGDSSILKHDGAIPIVCGPARKVLAMQIGTLDVVDPKQGDTRGVVAAVTRTSITAPTTMTLPSTGVVGGPVAIVDGRGKGQWRLVTEVSSRVISVDRPWLEMPAISGATDSDGKNIESTFQLGAMPWRWKSGWAEWPVKEHNQPRKISVGFQPSREANQMDLRVYEDYADEPTSSQLTWPRNPSDSIGVKTEADSPDAEINLQQTKGYAQVTIDSFAMYDDDREDIVSVELAGFFGASPVVVYTIGLYGAVEK